MSMQHQQSLPWPSPEQQRQEQEQSSRQSQPPGRRTTLTAACNRCRERKMRCPGQRPSCEKCHSKALDCVYETLPGETRSALRKSKNKRREHDLNVMMELYWYLQSRSTDDVAKAIAAIQSGADPDQVMELLKAGESSPEAINNATNTSDGQNLEVDAQDCDNPLVSARNRSLPTPDQPSNLRGNERLLGGEVTESTVVPERKLLRTHSPTARSPIAKAMLHPSNLIAALSSGVEAFISCTGSIFYIYDHDEALHLLDVVRPFIEDAGEDWPQLILRDSAPRHLKVALCSVSIMAAVGLQYTKDVIPAMAIEPSSKNGTYQYVTILYEVAKHLIDAAVEHDILEAMKVCAALCVFNAIGHATMALAHADMGINFALNLGPSLQSCPAGLNGVTWVNYKRLTRTLVTLRNWMITTLGYVSSENPGLWPLTQWLSDSDGLARTEVIQQELSKVVHLEANLLRTFDSFGAISPPVFSSIRRDLSQWYEKLPRWMHLNTLAESTTIDLVTRRTVYLVHLYYLSASILVARLAHGGKNPSPPVYDSEESRIAASDGILAARTASRILQLQLDDGTIFQRCWLCEFTSYMSCLILLHSAAKMALHGCPRSILEQELSYAKSCLDVLDYCGLVDRLARHFADTVRGHYSTLNLQTQQDRDVPVAGVPPSFDYLFGNADLPAVHIDQAAQDLLRLIRYPFGKPSNFHMEGTLKAGLGCELDWEAFITLPFNRTTSDPADSVPLLGIAISSLGSGHFIGSAEPHGWDSLLNPDNL